MDAIERKAQELTRERANRVCETCRNKRGSECEVTADKNGCIYNDMEFWQPNKDVLYELAEQVLEKKND